MTDLVKKTDVLDLQSTEQTNVNGLARLAETCITINCCCCCCCCA